MTSRLRSSLCYIWWQVYRKLKCGVLYSLYANTFRLYCTYWCKRFLTDDVNKLSYISWLTAYGRRSKAVYSQGSTRIRTYKTGQKCYFAVYSQTIYIPYVQTPKRSKLVTESSWSKYRKRRFSTHSRTKFTEPVKTKIYTVYNVINITWRAYSFIHISQTVASLQMNEFQSLAWIFLSF